MENVKGLVTGDMKLIFKDILTQLKNSGYDVRVKLMNAMYYNCATSRERIIFIGVRNDLNIPASHPRPQTKPISVKQCLRGFQSKYHTPITNKFVKQILPILNEYGSLSKYHPKGSYFNFINIDPNKPCNTITLSGYKMLIYNKRILEPDEAALLQSFPKKYKWIGKPSQIWARIGNSVPPNLMKAIALHIKENILDKIK